MERAIEQRRRGRRVHGWEQGRRDLPWVVWEGATDIVLHWKARPSDLCIRKIDWVAKKRQARPSLSYLERCHGQYSLAEGTTELIPGMERAKERKVQVTDNTRQAPPRCENEEGANETYMRRRHDQHSMCRQLRLNSVQPQQVR